MPGCGPCSAPTRRSRCPEGAQLVLVEGAALDRLSGTMSPRGPVAVIDIPRSEPVATDLALVLCGLADPGNVGSLIRTAAAFGAGVIVGTWYRRSLVAQDAPGGGWWALPHRHRTGPVSRTVGSGEPGMGGPLHRRIRWSPPRRPGSGTVRRPDRRRGSWAATRTGSVRAGGDDPDAGRHREPQRRGGGCPAAVHPDGNGPDGKYRDTNGKGGR